MYGVGAPKKILISGFHGRNLEPSLHGGDENLLGEGFTWPWTSYQAIPNDCIDYSIPNPFFPVRVSQK